VKTDIQTTPPSLNGSRRLSAASVDPGPLNNSPVPPKAKGVSMAKATAGSKAKHAAQRASRASRSASKPEQLVCRYCGSDDLCAVLHQAARRALPRLLQATLRFGRAPQDQESERHAEAQGGEVVQGQGQSHNGAGPFKGVRPCRVNQG
jgi:hypothetical protein